MDSGAQDPLTFDVFVYVGWYEKVHRVLTLTDSGIRFYKSNKVQTGFFTYEEIQSVQSIKGGLLLLAVRDKHDIVISGDEPAILQCCIVDAISSGMGRTESSASRLDSRSDLRACTEAREAAAHPLDTSQVDLGSHSTQQESNETRTPDGQEASKPRQSAGSTCDTEPTDRQYSTGSLGRRRSLRGEREGRLKKTPSRTPLEVAQRRPNVRTLSQSLGIFKQAQAESRKTQNNELLNSLSKALNKKTGISPADRVRSRVLKTLEHAITQPRTKLYQEMKRFVRSMERRYKTFVGSLTSQPQSQQHPKQTAHSPPPLSTTRIGVGSPGQAPKDPFRASKNKEPGRTNNLRDIFMEINAHVKSVMWLLWGSNNNPPETRKEIYKVAIDNPEDLDKLKEAARSRGPYEGHPMGDIDIDEKIEWLVKSSVESFFFAMEIVPYTKSQKVVSDAIKKEMDEMIGRGVLTENRHLPTLETEMRKAHGLVPYASGQTVLADNEKFEDYTMFVAYGFTKGQQCIKGLNTMDIIKTIAVYEFSYENCIVNAAFRLNSLFHSLESATQRSESAEPLPHYEVVNRTLHKMLSIKSTLTLSMASIIRCVLTLVATVAQFNGSFFLDDLVSDLTVEVPSILDVRNDIAVAAASQPIGQSVDNPEPVIPISKVYSVGQIPTKPYWKVSGYGSVVSLSEAMTTKKVLSVKQCERLTLIRDEVYDLCAKDPVSLEQEDSLGTTITKSPKSPTSETAVTLLEQATSILNRDTAKSLFGIQAFRSCVTTEVVTSTAAGRGSIRKDGSALSTGMDELCGIYDLTLHIAGLGRSYVCPLDLAPFLADPTTLLTSGKTFKWEPEQQKPRADGERIESVFQGIDNIMIMVKTLSEYAENSNPSSLHMFVTLSGLLIRLAIQAETTISPLVIKGVIRYIIDNRSPEAKKLIPTGLICNTLTTESHKSVVANVFYATNMEILNVTTLIRNAVTGAGTGDKSWMDNAEVMSEIRGIVNDKLTAVLATSATVALDDFVSFINDKYFEARAPVTCIMSELCCQGEVACEVSDEVPCSETQVDEQQETDEHTDTVQVKSESGENGIQDVLKENNNIEKQTIKRILKLMGPDFASQLVLAINELAKPFLKDNGEILSELPLNVQYCQLVDITQILASMMKELHSKRQGVQTEEARTPGDVVEVSQLQRQSERAARAYMKAKANAALTEEDVLTFTFLNIIGYNSQHGVSLLPTVVSLFIPISLSSVFSIDLQVTKFLLASKAALIRVANFVAYLSDTTVRPLKLPGELKGLLSDKEVKNIGTEAINLSVCVQQLVNADKEKKIETSHGQETNTRLLLCREDAAMRNHFARDGDEIFPGGALSLTPKYLVITPTTRPELEDKLDISAKTVKLALSSIMYGFDCMTHKQPNVSAIKDNVFALIAKRAIGMCNSNISWCKEMYKQDPHLLLTLVDNEFARVVTYLVDQCTPYNVSGANTHTHIDGEVSLSNIEIVVPPLRIKRDKESKPETIIYNNLGLSSPDKSGGSAESPAARYNPLMNLASSLFSTSMYQTVLDCLVSSLKDKNVRSIKPDIDKELLVVIELDTERGRNFVGRKGNSSPVGRRLLCNYEYKKIMSCSIMNVKRQLQPRAWLLLCLFWL